MQTSLRRKHRDRVVRRGLALIIESDFYATDAGRQHFADQLTSIRYCVQETCNFDTLYAYLSTANYDFSYDRSKNLRPKRNIKTAMNNGAHICNLCLGISRRYSPRTLGLSSRFNLKIHGKEKNK